jgi:hypothetical protein
LFADLVQSGSNATELNRHPGLVPGSTGRQAPEKEAPVTALEFVSAKLKRHRFSKAEKDSNLHSGSRHKAGMTD